MNSNITLTLNLKQLKIFILENDEKLTVPCLLMVMKWNLY